MQWMGAMVSFFFLPLLHIFEPTSNVVSRKVQRWIESTIRICQLQLSTWKILSSEPHEISFFIMAFLEFSSSLCWAVFSRTSVSLTIFQRAFGKVWQPCNAEAQIKMATPGYGKYATTIPHVNSFEFYDRCIFQWNTRVCIMWLGYNNKKKVCRIAAH